MSQRDLSFSSANSVVFSAEAARIFILSDVRLYREGLSACLSHQPSLKMLGTADSSVEGISIVFDLCPDVVVLDTAIMRVFEIAKSIRARSPTVKIVAFGVAEVEHELIACAEAGISGYVARDGSEKDLLAAIENTLHDELQCSPRVAGLLFRLVGVLSSQRVSASGSNGLTNRQREILGLVDEGMSNKEIALALRIGIATVKNHVHTILEKLHVQRRSQAAAWLRETTE
jgi:two-component system nitrate/nitrite response regulator NarL